MMRLLVINSSNNLLQRALQARSLRLTVVKGTAALLMVVAVLTSASLAAPQYASATGNPFPLSGPEFSGAADGPTSPVEVGQSFSIYFRVMNITSLADHGGISVSFPKFTQLGAGSDYYSSSQGSVNTRFYATGDSNVSYYERGDLLWNSRNEQKPAKHLLVEADDASWPTTAYRVLELEVTPKQAGTFKIYYRFWICGDGYSDCTRKPTGRDVYGLDQQGWAAGALIIQVEEPRPENRAPSVSAVSPLASLILRAGDRQGFTARATDPDDNISQVRWLVNGREMSDESLSLTGSVDRTYFHTFPSGGSYQIEAVFTDTEGASDSTYWDVVVIEPPVVRSLGCSATRVQVGETVSCNPNLGGGSPTRYLWGSIGGTPWSGTERNYATHWDSPGQKQIVFEVCNDDGCDTQGHTVVVEPPTDPAPRINRLGCSATRVQVGETVSCNPNLDGGSPTRYLWGSIGGTPWSGTERNYATHWDSPGQKQIVFEVCNDDGCDTQGHTVVVEPPTDPAPRINRLGCSATRVQVGETVSCNPNLGGGSPTRYLWGSIGGTPWSGTERNYATHWDSPGQKQIVFEVCNDDGCDTQGHTVVVEPPTDPAPRINRLGCSATRVQVGETVSCNPNLGGGSPTRYLWGSIGGTPWSGTERNYATHWDSPGQKQIVFEVCNDDGCDTQGHTVVVEPPTDPAPRINRLGCSATRVQVGETVSCNPNLGGGSPTRYLWRSIGGTPWWGTERNYATHWDSPGQKQIAFEVCNDGGCYTRGHKVVVEPPTDPAPRINRLGCSATRVQVGETVSCNPNLGGGSPTRYLWGSIGGTPWSGTERNYATHWDSPGQKQIAFEVCNDDGCDTRGHTVVVEPPTDPVPRIDLLGCSSASVKVGETVSCRPVLTGGSPTRYQWRSIGGSPSSGNRPTFTTSWGSPGQKQIALEVCNDGGCDAIQSLVVVDSDPPATLRFNATGAIIPGSSIDVISSGFRLYSMLDYLKIGSRTVPLQLRHATDGNGAFQVTIVVPNLPPGTYDLVAEVDGKVASTTIRIESPPPPNRSPTVSHVLPLQSLRLDAGSGQVFTAEANDPDENLSTVEWFFNGTPMSKGSLHSTGFASESLIVDALSPGNHYVIATFTDTEGASESVEWRFEVVQPPQVDSLGCSPITVQVEETVRCKPSLSGGDTATYAWEAEGGTLWSGYREDFSTSWGASGKKEIGLKVCNDRGVCDQEVQAITVEPPTPPPQVDSLGCSPTTVQVEETVRCKPSLNGGDTATYAWEAEGGTLWSGYREDFSTSWGASGKKEIGLKVCNDRGVCDQEVQAITVEPPTPPPQVDSLGCSPTTVQVEETVRCKPSLSGGDTATYAWEAEGGTLWSGYREDFSTSWGASGKKEIGLKVCNDRGVCDQEVQAITVEPPTPPPQVDSLGCSPTTVQVEETVRCKPSLSGGDTATYAWEAEGGTLWSGYREDFSTSWGASGKKEIGLKVCNDRGVCDQEVQAITVEPPTPPPQVDSQGVQAITVEPPTSPPQVDSQGVQAITVEPPTSPPQVDSQGVQAITAVPPTSPPQVDSQGVQAITAVPPTSPPQVDSMGCSPITVQVEETVRCKPSLSGGDTATYTWEAEGGTPQSGNREIFSTKWSSSGQKHIMFEMCNSVGYCSFETQRITVEDLIYVGDQNTNRENNGSCSFPSASADGGDLALWGLMGLPLAGLMVRQLLAWPMLFRSAGALVSSWRYLSATLIIGWGRAIVRLRNLLNKSAAM